MKVFVPTCDKYLWALRPFAYLMGVYWSNLQPVTVMGYSKPNFALPPNFEFVSIDKRNYGPEEWSNGLIKFLSRWEEDIFCLMLEDYWLTRTVNHQAVNSLVDFMRQQDDVLRIDLTSDRLHSGAAIDVATWGYVDVIETPPGTPYRMSTQACLVNRKNFLRCLKPNVPPWDFEMYAEIPDELRVFGTRQWPVRYINGIGMNLDKKYRYRTAHIRQGVGGKTIERIPLEHREEMERQGILPDGGYHGE